MTVTTISCRASMGEACRATLVPMTVEECLELLGMATVGRLVFTDRALPVILPVFVSVEETHVLLRSITGTDVSSIVDGSVIALEAGPITAAPCVGWSVTVTGRAFTTRDTTTQSRQFAVEGCPSADGGELLELQAGLVSGHRLVTGAGLTSLVRQRDLPDDFHATGGSAAHHAVPTELSGPIGQVRETTSLRRLRW